MEVHFTPEQEAQLAQIAARAGTHIEYLVKDTALRLLAETTASKRDPQPAQNNPLPVWHLGVMVLSAAATSTMTTVEPAESE